MVSTATRTGAVTTKPGIRRISLQSSSEEEIGESKETIKAIKANQMSTHHHKRMEATTTRSEAVATRPKPEIIPILTLLPSCKDEIGESMETIETNQISTLHHKRIKATATRGAEVTTKPLIKPIFSPQLSSGKEIGESKETINANRLSTLHRKTMDVIATLNKAVTTTRRIRPIFSLKLSSEAETGVSKETLRTNKMSILYHRRMEATATRNKAVTTMARKDLFSV